MHKKIPDSYSKREGGNPRNSGLFSQHPRAVWKYSYAQHEVTFISHSRSLGVPDAMLCAMCGFVVRSYARFLVTGPNRCANWDY